MTLAWNLETASRWRLASPSLSGVSATSVSTHMRQQFDLVVIGTGTAAGVVAHTCRRAGWSVAVIDSRPFGGTCALRGCDPKKVLVAAAEAVDQMNRLRGKGVRADALRVEWSELMRFKRGMIEAVPGQREEGFARAAVQQQLANAGLATFFDRSFSVDTVRRFKPAAEAYRSVADSLGVPMDRLRLVAAHAWDVVGALRAGCAAAFVARPGKVLYPLGPKPDISGPDLRSVAKLIVTAESQPPR